MRVLPSSELSFDPDQASVQDQVFEEAIESLFTILKYSPQRLPHTDLLSLSPWRLHEALLKIGHSRAEIIHVFETAVVSRTEVKDREVNGKLLHNIAYAYFQNGQLDQALHYTRKVIREHGGGNDHQVTELLIKATEAQRANADFNAKLRLKDSKEEHHLTDDQLLNAAYQARQEKEKEKENKEPNKHNKNSSAASTVRFLDIIANGEPLASQPSSSLTIAKEEVAPSNRIRSPVVSLSRNTEVLPRESSASLESNAKPDNSEFLRLLNSITPSTREKKDRARAASLNDYNHATVNVAGIENVAPHFSKRVKSTVLGKH